MVIHSYTWLCIITWLCIETHGYIRSWNEYKGCAQISANLSMSKRWKIIILSKLKLFNYFFLFWALYFRESWTEIFARIHFDYQRNLVFLGMLGIWRFRPGLENTLMVLFINLLFNIRSGSTQNVKIHYFTK